MVFHPYRDVGFGEFLFAGAPIEGSGADIQVDCLDRAVL
jgi:hypothetical protein